VVAAVYRLFMSPATAFQKEHPWLVQLHLNSVGRMKSWVVYLQTCAARREERSCTHKEKEAIMKERKRRKRAAAGGAGAERSELCF
jgi:hypothetical protein